MPYQRWEDSLLGVAESNLETIPEIWSRGNSCIAPTPNFTGNYTLNQQRRLLLVDLLIYSKHFLHLFFLVCILFLQLALLCFQQQLMLWDLYLV
jgi:hypothetical protein